MSDVMLHGVLNMPPELWSGSPIDVMQRHSRYLQASQYIGELTEQRDEAREAADKWEKIAHDKLSEVCRQIEKTRFVTEQRDDLQMQLDSSHGLLCFGVPCDLQTWLDSPERVIRHVRDGMTARDINRNRWGSYVPVRVDVEELKACARRGLLRCEKGRWFVQHNKTIDDLTSERDEARESLAELRASILDLSHPNIKMILSERDEARFDLDFRRRLGDLQNKTIDDLTKQRDEALNQLRKAQVENDHNWQAMELYESEREQRDRLAEALQKLADCDWVITLPDRMDAVRTIAREALQSLP